MKRGDARIGLLLQILDQAFTAKGWQGATLTSAVRGLTPAQALWRPRRGAHSIWEIVLHTAYWKHVVRQRVEGGSRSAFSRSPRNWPRLPERCDGAAWRAEVALLKREHELLRRAVRFLAPSRLDAPVRKSPWAVVEQIFGIAAHDLYHTGQIQLLKRLQRKRMR